MAAGRRSSRELERIADGVRELGERLQLELARSKESFVKPAAGIADNDNVENDPEIAKALAIFDPTEEEAAESSGSASEDGAEVTASVGAPPRSETAGSSAYASPAGPGSPEGGSRVGRRLASPDANANADSGGRARGRASAPGPSAPDPSPPPPHPATSLILHPQDPLGLGLGSLHGQIAVLQDRERARAREVDELRAEIERLKTSRSGRDEEYIESIAKHQDLLHEDKLRIIDLEKKLHKVVKDYTSCRRHLRYEKHTKHDLERRCAALKELNDGLEETLKDVTQVVSIPPSLPPSLSLSLSLFHAHTRMRAHKRDRRRHRDATIRSDVTSRPPHIPVRRCSVRFRI